MVRVLAWATSMVTGAIGHHCRDHARDRETSAADDRFVDFSRRVGPGPPVNSTQTLPRPTFKQRE
jgi:hypothetical protein